MMPDSLGCCLEDHTCVVWSFKQQPKRLFFVEPIMKHTPQPYRPPQGSTPKQRSDRNARIIAGVTSLGVMLFSFPCASAGIYDLATGTAKNSGSLSMAILFGGFGLIGLMLGIWAIRSGKKEEPQLDASSEHMVLSLAKSNQGILTVAELSLQAHVSLEHSEQLLENMTNRNVAEVDISSDGSIVYVFPAFARPSQESHQDRADLNAFSEQLTGAAQETQFDFQSSGSHEDGSVGQNRQQSSPHRAQNATPPSTYNK